MPAFGKIALVVMTGGIALGAMLGAAADPEMKQPPAPPWRAAQLQIADNAAYRPAETWPADTQGYRDSYAPSWANEELVDWEPEYPAWTYSEIADQPAAAEGPAIEADPAEPPQAEAAETLAPEPKIEANLDALY